VVLRLFGNPVADADVRAVVATLLAEGGDDSRALASTIPSPSHDETITSVEAN